ncbi:helix-turn-helix domain-containing protein [Microbispora sp. KK1-11]|uniref:AraC-like ligand-binding domain-containing protein n=1 Tax=Microbispora sp. KK1-11 TaxID=2053005 RepID=UPI00115A58F7|nr:helix-turn-helix domain-containing protein [Microbispora sp. KK1-11]TQS20009.1 helix-turn-helix domain-containing protein [Microbispora sp. KK1-11]
MQVIMSTDGLPPAERFEGWLDHMSQLVVPVRFSSDNRADFHGRIEAMDLGGVQISSHLISGCDAFRTSRLIRQSDPELFYLLCTLSGRINLVQERNSATLGRLDMALYHTSRPYHVRAGGKQGNHALLLAFPGGLLPFAGRALEQNIAKVLPGSHGIGALVATFLRGLAADRSPYSPADLVRLGITLTDLVTMLLGHHLDAALPPDAGRRSLLLRIHAHIQRNLGDRTLSPATIATAHNISVRTLHRLFALENMTVARWIRTQRLEHCRRDLVRPTVEREPIHATAARWGFSDAAVFTRAFRAAYGMSPQEYQARNLPASSVD